MCFGVNCTVLTCHLGAVHVCATTGVNRGCHENELKCPFNKTDSASLGVACRLSFYCFLLVQVTADLGVCCLPFLAHISDCADQVPLAVLVPSGIAELGSLRNSGQCGIR